MTEADRRIAKLADRQHGAFNRDQAFSAGASGRLQRARVATGDWLEFEGHVFALPSSAGTWFRQVKIAELGARDAAVACRAAAVLHDLTGYRPGRPEIWVPLTSRTRSSIAIVHRFAGAEITTVKGFRCTTIAQTLFDIAAHGTAPWPLERAMDDVIRDGRLTVEQLEERLSALVGTRRHGLAMMRGLVEERRAGGWTPPQSDWRGRWPPSWPGVCHPRPSASTMRRAAGSAKSTRPLTGPRNGSGCSTAHSPPTTHAQPRCLSVWCAGSHAFASLRAHQTVVGATR